MSHHEIVMIGRPSTRALRKMRGGSKVRVYPHMEGQGVSLIVSPEKFNHITRAFGRGKAYTIELSPTEIEANLNPPAELAPKMEGGSIFDSIKKGLKKAGKAIKPVAIAVGKEVLPIAKEYAKKGVKQIASYAPEIGATALGGLAGLAGQPELIPIASSAGYELGKQLGGLGERAINKQIDAYHPFGQGLYGSGLEPRSRGVARDPLAEANMGVYHANKVRSSYDDMFVKGQEKLHGFGLYGSGLYGSGLGGGLYAQTRMRGRGVHEKSSVGIHGNLLGHGMPPALESQPYGANFQFAHRLPPAYQKLNSS